MNYGKVVQSEDIMIVFFGTDEAYGVAPKSIDPWGKYDYEDVMAYVEANPHMVIPGETFEERMSLESEYAQLKKYLTDTDWHVIKCMELGVSMAVRYPEVHQQRTEARERINEIEEVLRTEEDV